MDNNSFFCNKKCEYFPCHNTDNFKSENDFNCFFCYCPLYLMGDECGGDFIYVGDSIKDCSNCLIPHKKENIAYINNKLYQYTKRKNKEALMKIKAVAIDLDHTLLEDEFDADEETLSVIPKLKEAGYLTIICTARYYNEAIYFVEKMNPDYLISDNGALITKFTNGHPDPIFRHDIPEFIRLDILSTFEKYDDPFYVMDIDNDIYISTLPQREGYFGLFLDYAERTAEYYPRINLHIMESVKEFPKDISVTRLFLMDYEGNEDLHRDLNALGKKYKKYGLKYICSYSNAYEFGTSDKGEAILFLQKYLGIDKDEMIGFGDSLADIPMFENVGISVAVDNAVPELKERANYITKSVFDHGVGYFVDNYLIKNPQFLEENKDEKIS